jgi:hypothetical protein
MDSSSRPGMVLRGFLTVFLTVLVFTSSFSQCVVSISRLLPLPTQDHMDFAGAKQHFCSLISLDQCVAVAVCCVVIMLCCVKARQITSTPSLTALHLSACLFLLCALPALPCDGS